MDMVVMPRRPATLEADRIGRNTETRGNMRLDENLADVVTLALIRQPAQRLAHAVRFDLPVRKDALQPIQVPAQCQPADAIRTGLRRSLGGLLEGEIADRRARLAIAERAALV